MITDALPLFMVNGVYTKIGWLCFGSGQCVYGNNSGINTNKMLSYRRETALQGAL